MNAADVLDRTLLLARDTDLIGRNEPTDEQLVTAFFQTRALIVADEANLACAAGQHALVGLVNQVARLGASVGLAMPDVPVVDYGVSRETLVAQIVFFTLKNFVLLNVDDDIQIALRTAANARFAVAG